MTGIQLSPEDINAYVAKAVLESAIGEQLRTVIDAEVKKLSASYNNPIQPIVQKIVLDVARDLITSEFKAPIEAQVREQLSEEMVNNLIKAAWDAIFRQINR